jgi:hypothetical protein
MKNRHGHAALPTKQCASQHKLSLCVAVLASMFPCTVSTPDVHPNHFVLMTTADPLPQLLLN